MIDWQILVNGEFPAGWDPHVDGCWFPDFAMQHYLLPLFDVGEQPINEYGGTVFDAGDLGRLYELKREAALEVIDKTLAMIDRALDLGGNIVFRGD